MKNSNLKRYLTLIWQRLTQPLPKWAHYLLFLLVFILFLHYENPALWDALDSASSAIWEFLLNIPSANLDLPWYVLVLGFTAYILITITLFIYYIFHVTIFKCEACNTEFQRCFLYFYREYRVFYSSRALHHITRWVKLSDKAWIRIIDLLEWTLFFFSIGIINLLVKEKMKFTCPKCGGEKWIKSSYMLTDRK